MSDTDPGEVLDPHTPTAPEDTGAPIEFDTVGSEPFAGEGTGETHTPDGVEAVEGYQPPEAVPELSTVLDLDEDLPDIGEASFGPSPESVIGTDDRVRISPASSYPWRAHASLRITANDGSPWIGTAWFVGPHTLITAGHCVFIRNSGVPGRDGWVRHVDVMPGRDGSSLPYGSTRIPRASIRSVTGWTVNGSHEYDYGALLLPNNDLGSRTGWLGAANFSDSTLTSSVGNLSGYPGDKAAGTQWYHARRIQSVGPRKVYYDIDTFRGQSGSAVYVVSNGARHAVAIHAYGGSSNSGTRINAGVLNTIVSWRA